MHMDHAVANEIEPKNVLQLDVLDLPHHIAKTTYLINEKPLQSRGPACLLRSQVT